jgi:hypothetical protein
MLRLRVLVSKLPKPKCPAFLIDEMRFHIVMPISLQGIFFLMIAEQGLMVRSSLFFILALLTSLP